MSKKKIDAKSKAMIIGGLGYFILPTDLIPDFMPAIGFTDDMAALLMVFKSVGNLLSSESKSKAVLKSKEILGDKFNQKDMDRLLKEISK